MSSRWHVHAKLLSRGSTEWPIGLADLQRDEPASLRVVGALDPHARRIAIVGTRYADADALGFTERLAGALAARGVTVVSGGAFGIDAAAHRGALAVGGTTLAVLPSGFAPAYPKRHAELFREIAATGALVSEAQDGDLPRPPAFLRRNRLVAALADSVVIVQAPVPSGALSTAAWANQLKRRVFAVPHAPWDPRGAGCLALLRQGACICTSAADALSLRPSAAAQLPLLNESINDDAGLSEPHRRLLRALAARRMHPDELGHVLDMTAAALQEALLTLQLAGLIRPAADGSYQKVRD